MFNQYQMIPTPQTVNTNYYSLLSSEQDLNEIADDTTVVASNISTSSTRWPDDGHRTVRSNSRSSALAIREHQNDTAGFESLPLFPGTSSYVHSGTKIVKPKFESPTSVTPQSTVQEPQAPHKKRTGTTIRRHYQHKPITTARNGDQCNKGHKNYPTCHI